MEGRGRTQTIRKEKLECQKTNPDRDAEVLQEGTRKANAELYRIDEKQENART